MNYHSLEDFSHIAKNKDFKNAIDNCDCLITLSNWLKYILKKYFKKIRIAPIKTIYHPTIFDCNKFTLEKFNNNKKNL